MQIKNVVFDVGNVLVRWDPHRVIQDIFPGCDPIELYGQMRPVWLDLNLGKRTIQEAIPIYADLLHVSEEKISTLMHHLTITQTPISGSLELLEKLKNSRIPLYSITNNIKDFIAYHRQHSQFLDYFTGIVVSAEVGILKPNLEIYRFLLDRYGLHASECIFIDDLLRNVEAALLVGMQAFQFTDIQSCEKKLFE